MINENTQNINSIFEKLVFIYKLPIFDEVKKEDLLYLKEMNEEYQTKKEFNKKNFVTIKNTVKKLIISEYFKIHNKIEDYKNCLNQTNKIEDINISNKIANDIIEGYRPYQELQKHEDRIISMFLEQFSIQDTKDVKLIINDDKGVNPGYIIKTTKSEYYIKTFSNDLRLNTKGKIDPCELLVYKIMEYTGFGPETSFLIDIGSSESGSHSIHSGNYIVTKSLNTDETELFLDLPLIKERFNDLESYEKFAIEIQSAIAIRDILSLWDTFNVNPKNYGILLDKKGNFKVQFIDHLPNANNGTLTNIYNSHYKDEYSPRVNLEQEFNNVNYKKDRELSPIVELAIKSKKYFTTEDLKKLLYIKLFNENEKSNLYKAIDNAYLEILSLIKAYSVNFVEDAENVLLNYKNKIDINISTFKKCMGLSIFDNNLKDETKFYISQEENLKLLDNTKKSDDMEYKSNLSSINNDLKYTNSQDVDLTVVGNNDLENQEH